MSAANLKIKTEPRPNSRLSIELEVPAERCQASYNDAISRLSRSIKLPGFRKGKVPKAVLLQQIGLVRIRATALESLVDGIWREVIQEASIEPLCEPELKDGFENLLAKFNPNEAINLTLETDIAPTPTLNITQGLQAEAEAIPFDLKKIDELIEKSRKELSTLVPIEDRAAAIGDVAVVSFKGTYNDNGKEIEGGSGDSMDIDLEEGRMIPGFVEGIVGMQLNDTKTLKCQFPDDYPEEVARGRKASFVVTLKDLKTRELPELNDAFAQQSSEKSSLAELREDLEKQLTEDVARRNKKNRQEALLDALVKQLEVDLPKTLVDQEVRNLVEQTASQFAQQGMDVKSMFTPELVKSLMESSRGEAEINLQRNFALNALSKAEGIEIDDNAVEKKFKEVSLKLANEKNIDPQKLRQAVYDDLLQEKLFEWLEENNTVIEKAPEQTTNETNQQKSTKKPANSKSTDKKTKAKKETKVDPTS